MISDFFPLEPLLAVKILNCVLCFALACTGIVLLIVDRERDSEYRRYDAVHEQREAEKRHWRQQISDIALRCATLASQNKSLKTKAEKADKRQIH